MENYRILAISFLLATSASLAGLTRVSAQQQAQPAGQNTVQLLQAAYGQQQAQAQALQSLSGSNSNSSGSPALGSFGASGDSSGALNLGTPGIGQSTNADSASSNNLFGFGNSSNALGAGSAVGGTAGDTTGTPGALGVGGSLTGPGSAATGTAPDTNASFGFSNNSNALGAGNAFGSNSNASSPDASGALSPGVNDSMNAIGGNPTEPALSAPDAIGGNPMEPASGAPDATDSDTNGPSGGNGDAAAKGDTTTDGAPSETESARPNKPDTPIRRALASLRLGKYDQCLDILNIILQTDPRNSQIHYLKGVCYVMTRHYSQASQEYRTCLQLNPPAAIMNLAQSGLAKLNH